MVIYKGVSNEKQHIFYQNISSEIIPVKVKVYESYTNGFMFDSDIDMEPNVVYYTYIHPPWSDRKVMIHHRKTDELITPFIMDGSKSLSQIDKFGYIKNIFELETDLSCQSGIHDVLREHLFDRQYKDFCEIEVGDIVVDVGFNYGIFSLGALNKGASKIYGLEPNKRIFNLIKENYPEKQKVFLYNFAVSDKNEIINFNVGYNTLSSSVIDSVSDYKESYNVQCVNIYDFIVLNQINKIDFLKIDCEGTEYKIYDAIPDEYFKTIKKIHTEFHFNDGIKVKSIIDKLERNGFEWRFENERDYNSSIGLIFAVNKNL